MRRSTLAALFLLGKSVDAVSTVVVLRATRNVEETIPLARWLMAQYGLVGGMVALTALSFVAVACLAEFGLLVRRLLPEVTPRWYPGAVRATVYLVTGGWFAAVGVHNLLLLA